MKKIMLCAGAAGDNYYIRKRPDDEMCWLKCLYEYKTDGDECHHFSMRLAKEECRLYREYTISRRVSPRRESDRYRQTEGKGQAS